MWRLILAALFVLCGSASFAADSTVSALTAASTLTGPELLYCVQGAADRKCTATQLQTFSNSWQTTGFVLSAVNPLAGNNLNEGVAAMIACQSDVSNINPGFTDANCAMTTQNAVFGNNTYSTDTHSKTTFITSGSTMYGYAAGQRILHTDTLNCYGMGDCFNNSTAISYAGGVTAGDEGEAFNTTSSGLTQQNFLVLSTVASVPTQTTCAASTTQNITGGYIAQTVTVSSTTNCNVNDWIMVDQLPNDLPPFSNSEAVKITAVGSGTLSGVFLNNHSTAAPILPALVLNIASTSAWGQHRELVDLSAASYSTGTVSSITGHTFTGSGTTWATNMVGGTTSNIGCIALTADAFTGAPFTTGSGALNSWYKILAVAGTTSLTIASESVANDQNYYGKGPGTGGYIISPCSESMHQIGNNEVILESNTATWTAADNVELAISPYPDVSGMNLTFGEFTTGGTRRQGLLIRNAGARKFQIGLNIGGQMPTGGNTDYPIAYHVGIDVGEAEYAFQSNDSSIAALLLGNGGYPDSSTLILMPGYGSGTSIGSHHSNQGMDFKLTNDQNVPLGVLSSIGPTVIGTGTLGSLNWTGILGTKAYAFSALPTCASGLEGMMAAITDSTTATWGATIAGSSTNHVMGRCNGTNWTVVGM